jgi:2-polyprenyl-3-methyl-5-hydroxy-6-metoxy-1,4-benzoquinol methylase
MTICPNCKSSKKKNTFNTWNNVVYSICQNCECAYQDPKLEFIYEEDHWEKAIDPDGVERNFTKERDFRVKNWFGDTIKFINQLKPGKILDVGCGLGCFLSAINNNWKKYGFEIGEFPINYIKNNYPNIKTLDHDLFNHDFKKNSFDVIMFYHVIEHVEEPEKFLDLFYSLLKKDGYLIIGTPNSKSFVANFFKKKFRHFGKQHILLYSPSALKTNLEKKNFFCEKIEFPYFNTDYSKFFNIFKLINPFSNVAPPFYGNIMTFYAKKK